MASGLERWRRGRTAEQAAAEYLRRRGYQVVRRNFRTRRGEIDLIAVDRGVIVFVEVKARSQGEERSLEAVDYRKRRRIVRAAQDFLASRRLVGAPARFDVAAVTLGADGRPQTVRLLQNAFAADE